LLTLFFKNIIQKVKLKKIHMLVVVWLHQKKVIGKLGSKHCIKISKKIEIALVDFEIEQ